MSALAAKLVAMALAAEGGTQIALDATGSSAGPGVGGIIVGLELLDWDGDPRLELLIARELGLTIADVRDDGSLAVLAQVPRATSRTLAWCLAPARAVNGARQSLLTLRDDGALQRHSAGAEPIEAARIAGLSLPAGVFPFPFARDLDGDGDADFALPAAGGLKLWFVGADGKAKQGPLVRHRINVTLDLPEPEDGYPEIGAAISIPNFDVEDQNGDGHPDLVFESEEHLQFFWTAANGALPEAPTLDIDLGELKAKLAPASGGMLDPANLFKALAGQVSADVRDFDGDRHADLLLRQGSKVSLFPGTRDGIDRSKAVQVLKVSGNLLDAFAFDDDKDGKQDLCLLQVADVSIGQVLLWVIVGGTLEFDLFTYRQEATLRFGKSPAKRRRLQVKLPALLGIADEFEENQTLERLADEFARQPVGLDLDGDGARGDVAQLRPDGTIALFRGKPALPEAHDASLAALRQSLVARFDAAAKGEDTLKVGLLDLVEWVPTPGAALRTAIAGREPAATLATPDPSAQRTDATSTERHTDRLLIAADLDGDGKDDLLLLDQEPLTVEWFKGT
ncbi:MAG: VCBS repeat-containing protein [Planctomycetes bacterium]|nr:VCBS repeat-containing protein [Planctomycetota bacterium]